MNYRGVGFDSGFKYQRYLFIFWERKSVIKSDEISISCYVVTPKTHEQSTHDLPELGARLTLPKWEVLTYHNRELTPRLLALGLRHSCFCKETEENMAQMYRRRPFFIYRGIPIFQACPDAGFLILFLFVNQSNKLLKTRLLLFTEAVWFFPSSWQIFHQHRSWTTERHQRHDAMTWTQHNKNHCTWHSGAPR